MDQGGSRSCDVLVVGGGSAGAVVAARLAETGRSIVLLEAGPDYRSVEAPPEMVGSDMSALLRRGGFHWPTLEARYTDARPPVPYHAGFGLGGGSAINAQIAIRPVPEDFERWPRGWSWHEVLDSFIRLETDVDFGSEAYHGASGPIPIVREPIQRWGMLDLALREAAEAAGHPWSPDHNAPGSTGVSPLASNNRAGRRVSTNDAYLEPVRDRRNLRIVGGALVDRVAIDGGRAVAVRVGIGGQWVEWRADEIVLAAGAIGSPAILLRSGVGDATDLRRLGIEPIVDLPSVGANLKEHPRIVVALIPREDGQRDPEQLRGTCCCVRFTTSHGPTNDVQLMSANWSSRRTGAITAALMAPTSAGSVSLASSDPTVDPAVTFRLVSTTADQQRLREAARHVFELARHDAITAITETVRVRGDGLQIDDFDDDATLDAWIAQECFEYHHPTGTCRMGDAADPDTVVDASLRVLGVEGLRVADASIFPDIPRANTNLTAIMIGEHTTALITGEARPKTT